jgi:hypothetical protein
LIVITVIFPLGALTHLSVQLHSAQFDLFLLLDAASSRTLQSKVQAQRVTLWAAWCSRSSRRAISPTAATGARRDLPICLLPRIAL